MNQLRSNRGYHGLSRAEHGSGNGDGVNSNGIKKFRRAEEYRTINAALIEVITDKIAEELGICSPGDIYEHVVEHGPEIRKHYDKIGLQAHEIDRTYENLTNQARKLRDGGRSAHKANLRYYGERRGDRRPGLTG